MPVYKTPNVYVEEISTLPPSVVPVSTAIPVFIGYTAEPEGFAYRDQPVRISSMLDYTRLFGGADNTSFIVTKSDDDSDKERIDAIDVGLEAAGTPKYLLYYSLRLFFANGGGSCYIVSVGKYGETLSKAAFENGISAIFKEDEPTLLLLTDAVNLTAPSAYYTLCQDVLAQCNKLKDRFAIFDVLESDGSTSTKKIGDDFRQGIANEYLKYGAAYYPYLQTSLNYQYTDESVTIQGPDGDDGVATATATLSDIKTDETELYSSIKTALNGMTVVLPPSGAIAGIYAKTDRERGVWKAPANVSLASVIAPTVKLTNDEQEDLNVHSTGKSINAIRSFTGKGTLVWGARTLAGNDNEWRYISVRRLFNLIEESIQKATGFVVFESNNAITWLKVKTLIETYLEGLWRQGAMAGSSAEDAFFVRLGLGQTMTEQDILEGKMKIEIGISAVRPAEFIVLQFSHKLQQS